MVKTQKLLRATRDRMSWRDMIAEKFIGMNGGERINSDGNESNVA